MRSPQKLALAALRHCLPLVPPKKRLPLFVLLTRADVGLEAELLHLRSFVPPGGVVIDVGANVGMFSYELAKFSRRVYAFEINPALTTDLKSYASPRIEIITSGLSSEAREVTLRVPVLANGMELPGWGSLEKDNVPPETARIKLLKASVRTLDSYTLNGITFIKIDVEGHECEVLSGARETIKRSRPTVLIEVRDANVLAVDSYFADLDYGKFALADLCGVRGSADIWIYKPH